MRVDLPDRASCGPPSAPITLADLPDSVVSVIIDRLEPPALRALCGLSRRLAALCAPPRRKFIDGVLARRGPSPEAREAVAGLRQSGRTVRLSEAVDADEVWRVNVRVWTAALERDRNPYARDLAAEVDMVRDLGNNTLRLRTLRHNLEPHDIPDYISLAFAGGVRWSDEYLHCPGHQHHLR